MAQAAPLTLKTLFDSVPELTHLWNDVKDQETELLAMAKDDSLNNNNGLVDYFEDLKIPQNKRYRVKGRLLAILRQEERSGMCNILFSVVFVLFSFLMCLVLFCPLLTCW